MIFYTDGSCKPSNPGPGGLGVVCVVDQNIHHTYYKRFDYTTNNRMELEAILYVMENYSSNPYIGWGMPPTVYSDSAYAVNALNEWIFSWSKNNWCKSNGNSIENEDLFKRYWERYQQGCRIFLKKVKGHAGNKWNELADKIASLPSEEEYKQLIKELYNE